MRNPLRTKKTSTPNQPRLLNAPSHPLYAFPEECRSTTPLIQMARRPSKERMRVSPTVRAGNTRLSLLHFFLAAFTFAQQRRNWARRQPRPVGSTNL